MTIYGYARTAIRDHSNPQIQELNKAGCKEIYYDVTASTTMDRPSLNALLDVIQAGDTFMMTSLDRLTRNVVDGEGVIKSLLSKGVTVHVLDMGIIEDLPINKVPLSILSAFADFEKRVRYDRLMEGKAMASKNPNYREGRKPIYSKQELDYAMKLKENHSFTELAELTGISIATLKRESARRKKQETE